MSCRTVEKECPDVLIHFVNQVFNEQYDVTDRVEYLRNEHFIQQEDGKVDERISDSHFRITKESEVANYHLECESSGYNKDILVRMFEYGVLDAIEDRKVNDNELSLRSKDVIIKLIGCSFWTAFVNIEVRS